MSKENPEIKYCAYCGKLLNSDKMCGDCCRYFSQENDLNDERDKNIQAILI